MFEYEPDHDVIPVRPDERLPEAELAEALRGKLTGAENPLRVSQFGGGAANLTYLLDYGTHQYVLRRPPLGPVARSAHDMRREYRVLSILHRAFPYAPRAYLYHADERLLGSDFFIMERKRGVVVRRSMPADYKDNSDAARRMGLPGARPGFAGTPQGFRVAPD
jgi:aminoglycoside phosphotransferase (APT) family kinase protein